jgi:hypothetical protein
MISEKIHKASHVQFLEFRHRDFTEEFLTLIDKSNREKFILINTPFYLENKKDDVFSQQYYFRDGGLLKEMEPYLNDIRSGTTKLVLLLTDWWGFCNWKETSGSLNDSNLVSYDIYNWLYPQFKTLGILEHSVFVSPISTLYTRQYADWPIVEFNEPFLRFLNHAEDLPNLKQLDDIGDRFDHFLFSLNRRPRSHRLYSCYKLYQNNLLDDAKFTFHFFDEQMNDYDAKVDYFKHTLESYGEYNIDYNFLNYIKDKTLDETYNLNENIQYKPEADILNLEAANCFIEVVNEYNCSNKKTFITEKTARAIVLRNPFVILGDRGSLLELQKQGFRTFSSMWDESYDLLPTYKERVDAVIKLLDTDIKKLYKEHKQWYPPELWDIIQYNRNWYFNDYKYQQIEKFKRIFE